MPRENRKSEPTNEVDAALVALARAEPGRALDLLARGLALRAVNDGDKAYLPLAEVLIAVVRASEEGWLEGAHGLMHKVRAATSGQKPARWSEEHSYRSIAMLANGSDVGTRLRKIAAEVTDPAWRSSVTEITPTITTPAAVGLVSFLATYRARWGISEPRAVRKLGGLLRPRSAWTVAVDDVVRDVAAALAAACVASRGGRFPDYAVAALVGWGLTPKQAHSKMQNAK